MSVRRQRRPEPTEPGSDAPPAPPARSVRVGWLHLALALVAYVPLLWSSPGQVSADTKTYLTTDPSRLLATAPHLWDPGVGLGTVTHQTIGYLLPMGPWFWLFEHLGVPDWVTQRLWLGTILFAAGAGVVFLLRTLGWWGRGLVVAPFAYLLSPYVLDYAARISVILLPFAALPWMLAFTIKALRCGPYDAGRWRWPALFAVTVALVGGVNATALVLAGLGPVVWIVHAVVAGKTPWRHGAAVTVRIGLLSLATSLWWIAGLIVQGRFGIPILRYTESYDAVASASTAPEVLRGLGYWFFYGGDKVGAWVGPSGPYQTSAWLVLVGFAVVALALSGATSTRFRGRGAFVTVLVVGTVVAVGAHPLTSSTPFGRVFDAFVATTPGMALRSTPRAIPLVALALAVGLGALAEALAGRLPRYGVVIPVACLALVALDMPPLFTGAEYTAGILRDETLPAYWTDAAKAMDARPHSTRVYELPGADFAAYRWGGTVDPITPGLIDRPYVARELIPYGSAPGADLLDAFEERLQDGVFEPSTLGPFARLISAGTLAIRSDLQYERYRTPRPKTLWPQILASGLPAPEGFGTPVPNKPIARLPLLDEIALSTPAGAPDPPPVALVDVPGARPIVRSEPAERPLVVAGDGDGLVDAAAAGLLPDGTAVLYSASTTVPQLDQALAGGADLLLTDSNRRRGERWGSVRETEGFTEQAGEQPLTDDPTDNRLAVFPGAGDDTRTVAEQRGVRSVRATGYGNPVTYTPEDRPANALDGDPKTAWRTNAFAPVVGQRLEVQLAAAVTTDHVTVLQPTTGPRNRWITSVRLRFDGHDALDVDLDDSSRVGDGQRLSFPSRTFTTLEVEVTAANVGKLPSYQGLTSVGLAELRIGDPAPRVDEVIRLPRDLLAKAGNRSDRHRLTVVLTRQRADQHEPIRSDPELAIERSFTLPSARSFTISGDARVSGVAPDGKVDAELGGAPPGFAVASDHLPGEPGDRGAAAVDGDRATAWTTPIDAALGQTLTLTAPAPTTLDHLDLAVVADGRHSVPTALSLSADGGPAVTITVPPVNDATPANPVATVPVTFPAVTGLRFTFRIVAVRAVRTTDYISERPVALPVAIAELGAAGLLAPAPAPAAAVPASCRTDLVSVDGTPVAVRIVGTVATALARQSPLSVEACNGPLALGAGDHVLRTAVGRDGGIDVDRLVLDSAAPGAAPPASAGTGAPRPAAPATTVLASARDSYDVAVDATGPFWLVLGQSHNEGWDAKLDGKDGADLGPPTLIDGYANGWFVQPTGPGRIVIQVRWTPQRLVWFSLAASAVGLALCLILIAVDGGSRRPLFDAAPLATWRPGPDGPRPSRRRRLVTPLAVLVGATVLAGPSVGLVSAVVAAVAVVIPRSRTVLAALPAAAIALTAAYVVAKTRRYHLPPGLDWPGAFAPVNRLGWLAVTLTGVLVLVDGLRARPRPSRPDR